MKKDLGFIFGELLKMLREAGASIGLMVSKVFYLLFMLSSIVVLSTGKGLSLIVNGTLNLMLEAFKLIRDTTVKIGDKMKDLID